MEDRKIELNRDLSDLEPLYSKKFSYSAKLPDQKNAIIFSFSIMMKDELVRDYISNRRLRIEDLIVSTIASLDMERISGTQGMEYLKQLLLDRINEFLNADVIDGLKYQDPKPIKKVLFSEYLLLPIEKLSKLEEIRKN